MHFHCPVAAGKKKRTEEHDDIKEREEDSQIDFGDGHQSMEAYMPCTCAHVVAGLFDWPCLMDTAEASMSRLKTDCSKK
jgi:hypothetical protein